MRKIFSIAIVVICFSNAYAQIGVNTSAPDDNAVLDLKATNKGLLIPRLTTVQREAMSNGSGFTQGMMVYDTNLDILFVGYGNGATGNTKWYAMNAWKTEYRTSNNADTAHMTTMTVAGVKHGNVGIGTATPSEKLEVNGNIKASDTLKSPTVSTVTIDASGTVNAQGNIKTSGRFEGYGTTPLGGIIMWSGNTAPDGWALCDGGTSNGYKTPDLRQKFIAGRDAGNGQYNQAGDLSFKGTTGGISAHGVDAYQLTAGQLPAHTHAYKDRYAFESQQFNPPSQHVKEYIPVSQRSNNNGSRGDSDNDSWVYYNTATSPSGAGHLIENRPPFYVLAFIMRVK